MLANRVREYTTTVGTGDITLDGALAGHVRFSDAFSASDMVIYVLEDGDNYEIGRGTLMGASTLARTNVEETLVDGVLTKTGASEIALSGSAKVYCAVSASYLLDPANETDVIREITPDAGVTVDGVLLKDGGITASADATFSGDVIPSVIRRDMGAGIMQISGGSARNLGGNLIFYGESHATNAGDAIFRSSTANWLHWDSSASVATFSGQIASIATSLAGFMVDNTVNYGMKDSSGVERSIFGYSGNTWSGAGGDELWIRNPSPLSSTLNFGISTPEITFDLSNGDATFAGDVTLSDTLVVTGAGSANIKVGNTSGAASGALITLDGWDGSSVASSTRMVGLADGGFRLDTNGTVTALHIDANQNTTFTGDVNIADTKNIYWAGSFDDHGYAGYVEGDPDTFGLYYVQNSGAPTGLHMSSTSEATGDGNLSLVLGGQDALAFDNARNATFSGDVNIGGRTPLSVLAGGSTGILNVQLSGVDTHLGYGSTEDNYITRGATGITRFRDTSGSTDLTLDASGAIFAGDVTIGGDLSFSGSATVINTTTVNTGDNIIVLNADVTGTPTENSGIEIERGTEANATILWNEAEDRFELNHGGSFAGNVGIGPSAGTPTRPLHINSGASGTLARFTTDIANTSELYIYADATRSGIFNQAAAGGSGVNLLPDGSIEFRQGATRSLIVDPSKNQINEGYVASQASDFQFRLLNNANEDWFLRHPSNGTFSIHRNATGDALTFDTALNASFSGDVTVDNSVGFKVGGINDTFVGKLHNNGGVLSITTDENRDIQFGDTSGNTLKLDTSAKNATFSGDVLFAVDQAVIWGEAGSRPFVAGSQANQQLRFGTSNRNRLVINDTIVMVNNNLDIKNTSDPVLSLQGDQLSGIHHNELAFWNQPGSKMFNIKQSYIGGAPHVYYDSLSTGDHVFQHQGTDTFRTGSSGSTFTGQIRAKYAPATIGGLNLDNAAILVGTTSQGLGLDTNEITQRGDDLYLTAGDATGRIFLNPGNQTALTLHGTNQSAVFGGNVTLGLDKNLYVRGAQNSYRGIVPVTGMNLMLGTGTGSEPRIYLHGSANGQSNAGDIFIGTASNSGTVYINGNTEIRGKVYATGGTKISVQNKVDGGSNQGIFLYDTDNTGYGIYMASPGTGKSLGNNTACAPLNGNNGWQTRFRAGNVPSQGFLWENSSEQCLMSLTPDTGDLYTKGNLVAGGAVTVAAQEKIAVSSTNIVDVFLYDTTEDSDGGAWRGRCRHTSWYREPLNTATRGATRKFPKKALIVAETDTVTIYDATKADCPMWMVFNAGGADHATNNMLGDLFGFSIKSIAMVNGFLVVGSSTGLRPIDFIRDVGKRITTSGERTYSGDISERNDGKGTVSSNPGLTIVNSVSNDVAITTLAGAEIDPATGLPYPTIAVATDGGASVINPTGTAAHADKVVNITCAHSTFTYSHKVHVSNSGQLWLSMGSGDQATDAVFVFNTIPTVDTQLTLNSKVGTGANADAYYKIHSGLGDLFLGGDTINDSVNAISENVVGTEYGLNHIAEDTTAPANGMVAYITTTYNTGWMPRDVRGCWLVDSVAGTIAGTELVTNGGFDTDTDWTKGSGITISDGVLNINSGADNTQVSQDLAGLVEGNAYLVEFDFVRSSGTSMKVRLGAGSNEVVYSNTGHYSLTIVAGSGPELRFRTNGPNIAGTIDNVSVREALPDRSVKGNGLAVHGSITAAPVATGADTMAYSGFSASNYLEQPYSPDLDFGTGDFGWFAHIEISSNSALEYIFERSDAARNIRYALRVTGAGVLEALIDDGCSPPLKTAVIDNQNCSIIFFAF